MSRKLVRIGQHLTSRCKDGAGKLKRQKSHVPCPTKYIDVVLVCTQKGRSGQPLDVHRSAYCDDCAKLIRIKYPDCTGGPGDDGG